MARLVIPTVIASGQEAIVQRTALDGREYLLSLTWNRRDERWYFGLADEEGTPIVQGVKVVAGWALLLRVRDERRPPGEIVVVDTTAQTQEGELDLQKAVDPGLEDLGERVLLVYLDEEEVAAAAA